MASVLSTNLMHARSYVGISVAGHVPMTMDKLSFTHLQASYGGDVGFVYEWQKSHFILQTGLNFSLDYPSLRVDSQWLAQDMIDTRGVPFIYRGILNNRTDRIMAGQLTVPLYIGAEWSGFYMMAGVKAVLNIHSKSSQRAQLMTAGDYGDRYYDWLEDMPNHGYYDYQPVQTDKPIKLRLYDIRVGAELGYSIYTSSPLIRIGVFAEYGVLEWTDNKNATDPRTQADYTHYMSVDMTHVYGSEEGVNS